MRIITFFALLFNLAFQVALATNVEMSVNDSEHLVEGDVFESIIRIWPYESSDYSAFKALQGRSLFGAFYVVSVNEINPSENNADLLEIKLTAIVKTTKKENVETLVVNGETLPVMWKGPSVNALKNKTKDYYILNQGTILGLHWTVILAICGAVAIVLFIFRKKLMDLFKRKKMIEEFSPQFFQNVFMSVSTREDFERVYALKDKWLPLLQVQSPAHREFFTILNQHQYKRHWSNDDLSEVKTAFEPIRRSFEVKK